MLQARASNACQSIEISLFAYFGIGLPAIDIWVRPPSRAAHGLCEFPRHLRLVDYSKTYSEPTHAEELSSQYSLPFMTAHHSNILKLLPRNRYVYLGYGVHDSFRHNPQLVKPALKLEEHGYLLIGQLVQLSEAEIKSLPYISEDQFEAMKAQLTQVGLDFGVRVPGWDKSAAPRR